jgi:ketosteroid isomerase-like protein
VAEDARELAFDEKRAVVEGAVEALNRVGAGAVLPYYTEDAVWYSPPGWIGAPEYRGHDGITHLAEDWVQHFVQYRWTPHRLLDADGDVLLLVTHGGRIRESDAEVDQPLAVRYRFRGPKVCEVRVWFSWAEGLAACHIEGPDG